MVYEESNSVGQDPFPKIELSNDATPVSSLKQIHLNIR